MSLRLVGPSESLGERDLRVRPLRPSGSLPAVALLAAPRPAGAGEPCDGPASLKSRWLCPLVGLASGDSEAVSSQLKASLLSPMARSQPRSVQGPRCWLICSCGSLFYRPSRFFPPVSLPPRSRPLHCGSLLQLEIREEMKQSDSAPSPWLWIHFGWWEDSKESWWIPWWCLRF